MKFDNVLVVGGSGFIGRHVVAALAARGMRVTVPSRRRERSKHLILLPTVDVVEADIFARGALERLMAGKQAVINLVGILHGDFHRLHVELPQGIVNACRAQGVARLLHMSALGASRDAPSEYLRSKALGEEVVLAATDLETTVLRPSVVFGPEDRFLNLFAQLSRFLPVLALACPQAQFQPVYVGDVARVFATALGEAESFGKRYDLCGPHLATLRQLVNYVCAVTRRRRVVIGLPHWASMAQAWTLEHLPGKLMTRDNVRSMQVANVCAEGCELPFGLVPQALEAIAPSYLAPSGPRERYPQLRWRARR
ncbi:MAG TPA: complex I NDUFA9 subunit family protein [Burkholderiales bacterium]|nr:complex I NDUFA9 subunit family protein [Burkholderiales bacterium]